MSKNRTPFQAAIGKLILELDRQYMLQVEDGQPLDSFELALHKAHDLLSCKTDDQIRERIGKLSLSRRFDQIWLSSYPAIAQKVAIADDILSSRTTQT